MKLNFFIYSKEKERDFLTYIRRAKQCTVVSFSQERFYKMHWPELHTYLETIKKQTIASLVLVREDCWWRDLRGQILISFWKLLKRQTNKEIFIIIPEDFAPYLHKYEAMFYGAQLYWNPFAAPKQGDMFYFDLIECWPIERKLDPPKQYTLLEVIQKSNGVNAVA
jgi:hypothetical protein